MIGMQTDLVRVELQPEGGRVTSLVDLRTGKDWIDSWGSEPGPDDQVYDHVSAGGWDECFPSVSASGNAPDPWGAVRDHGELWGRPPLVLNHDSVSCEMAWLAGPFHFRRSLRLEGASIIAAYHLENLGGVRAPWLWSQHALLRTHSTDGIRLSGLGPLHASWISDPTILDGWVGDHLINLGDGNALPAGVFFQSDRPWAAKLFAAVEGDARACLQSPEGAIEFRWSGRSPARYLGLWINNRGWPAGGALSHVAFEPTTCPCDGLTEAVMAGRAPILEAGQQVIWSVDIRLLAGAPNGGCDV